MGTGFLMMIGALVVLGILTAVVVFGLQFLAHRLLGEDDNR